MSSTLEPRSPSASRYEKIFPFSTDKELRESYVNVLGDLRFGRLMEDMDLTAGMIAYKHSDGFDEDLTIVTASCDRIDLIGPFPANCDLRLQGQVNHVGSSSMEIGMRMDTKCPRTGKFKLVAAAYFIMVARKNNQAAAVRKLLVETPEEQRRFEEAAERRLRARDIMNKNTMIAPPSAEEGAVLHNLFLKTRNNENPGMAMSETSRQATLLMHPQNKNIHNKIFGGHIMRQSFELAWNIGYLHCHKRPLYLSVDHFYFFKPVEIGSIVSFNGQITFTGKTSFIVEVVVEVINPATGAHEVTNVSYFTLVGMGPDNKPTPVPKVFPHSYEEGLKYLDGYRRYQSSKQIQEKRKEKCT